MTQEDPRFALVVRYDDGTVIRTEIPGSSLDEKLEVLRGFVNEEDYKTILMRVASDTQSLTDMANRGFLSQLVPLWQRGLAEKDLRKGAAPLRTAAEREPKPMSKKNGKEPETKHEKSVRLAKDRMTKLLGRGKQIENLTGPGYEFSPAEREAIVNALFDLARRIKTKFDKPAETGFDFA